MVPTLVESEINPVVIEARDAHILSNHGVVSEEGISFQVLKGQFFGLLGTEQSSKLHILKSIGCMRPVPNGGLFVFGLSVKEHSLDIKSRMGMCFRNPGFDEELTVFTNLMNYGRLFKLTNRTIEAGIIQAIQKTQLQDIVDTRIHNLSLSTLTRVALARALVTKPELLLIEDGLSHLDSESQILIMEILAGLCSEGITVVMSTHNSALAEQYFDHLLLLKKDRSITQGAPQKLIDQYVGQKVLEIKCAPQDRDYLVARIPKETRHQIVQNQIRIFLENKADDTALIKQFPSDHVTLRKSNLEDVYLGITGSMMIREGPAI